MNDIIDAPIKKLESFGVNGAWILIMLGILMTYFVFQIFDITSTRVFGFVFLTAPLWLPWATFLIFFDAWKDYVQKSFDLHNGRVTLEIKIPQEIFKSPEAMELVLMQMHQAANPDNHIQTYWDGKHPPVFGLELVSRGGDVRFYISTPRKKFKNIIEAQLYAQYPGIEVVEAPLDYTAEIGWNPEKFSYFAIHFGLKKADALPIKTYREYGLQTMPKEEEKIDPITSMLEMLGSIGQGEYIWIQILIDANREVTFKEGSLRRQPDWKDAARAEIVRIMEKARDRAGAETSSMMLLTDTEKETLQAIERSIGKNAFNVGIRAMYIARNENFLVGERIGAIITGWRSYDDINRNAIGLRWRTDYNWNWWQDPFDKKKERYKKTELRRHKLRSYVQNDPSMDAKTVMTTEELATIFHIPGKVVTTPTLGRIPSTRSEAPSNLPTG